MISVPSRRLHFHATDALRFVDLDTGYDTSPRGKSPIPCWLAYFVAVAEALSFTKAAETSHLSQPSLTRQVRDLKDEIGVKLLDRTRQQTALTIEGRSFLDDAKRVLALSTEIVETVQIEKIAEFTPSARVRTATAVKPGDLASCRKANLKLVASSVRCRRHYFWIQEFCAHGPTVATIPRGLDTSARHRQSRFG